MPKNSNTKECHNACKPMLADGIIEKAIELLPTCFYEPNHTGFFVKQDDEDMGNEDFCEACIDDAVLEAKNNNKARRNEILNKYKQIEETGFYNGKDCKHYPKELIESSKKSELKEYPKKSKFTYEGHDPDFSGGQQEPLSCPECGDYFYTNFEPDLDCAERLLEDLKENCLSNKKYKEELKWKLEIAFGNYRYCEADVQEILLQCAEIVIKTYSYDTIC